MRMRSTSTALHYGKKHSGLPITKAAFSEGAAYLPWKVLQPYGAGLAWVGHQIHGYMEGDSKGRLLPWAREPSILWKPDQATGLDCRPKQQHVCTPCYQFISKQIKYCMNSVALGNMCSHLIHVRFAWFQHLVFLILFFKYNPADLLTLFTFVFFFLIEG